MTAIGGTSASLNAGDEVLSDVTGRGGLLGDRAPPESGVLRVSILDAKDLINGLDVRPYAVVRIGGKEFRTKHAGKTVAPEWYVHS
jgi:hypothetical protein